MPPGYSQMAKVAWKDFHQNLNPKRRHPFKNFDKEKWKELMSFIEANYDEISRHMKYIMKTLGLDLEDDSLMDTPNRVAKM